MRRNFLKQLYFWLPPFLKNWVASGWGYYLRWWRYGPETRRLIEEAIERESWSESQWKAWREERLAYILHRAATRVPFYREYWNRRRRSGDRSSWEVLDNWPILEKEFVRKNPLDFIADDCNPRWMFKSHTSGTTGKPVIVYWRHKKLRAWYALYEARIRHWNDVCIKDRWVIFGGQLVISFSQKNPPFWVYNRALNQLYMSTFHLKPKYYKYYIEELKKYKPSHIICYPSSLSLLAEYILSNCINISTLKVIISNAETLDLGRREILAKAFQCPVRNTYGMAEAVLGASECEYGQLHVWPETGWVEMLEKSNKQGGSFIITGLFNEDMPLIRYRVGDRGLPPRMMKCSCGRSFPVLESLKGRDNDLILTPDGRKIFWLNPVFYGLPILEFQIIQRSIDHIDINVIPAAGFNDRVIERIKERMRQRVGYEISISVHIVETISRTAGGKIKNIISHLSN